MTSQSDRAQRVRELLVASVTGHGDRAVRLLRADPTLGGDSIWTAAVLGEADAVRRAVAADPALAVEPDAESGWPPLLAVCNSRWHQLEPARSRGLCEAADALIDAGASPDTAVGRAPAPGHCSALYAAAGLANHPALAELLLKRGADPDTPAALYHTAFHRDHVCLRLLLDHGARAEGPEALGAAISVDDVGAVRLLLDAGVSAAAPLPPEALGESYAPEPPVDPVHAAVELQASAELIALLLDRGADPEARGQDGRSAHQLAVRHGNNAVTALLRAHGAPDDASAVDRFLGACLRADRAAVDRHLHTTPDLVAGLTEADHRAIVQAAEHGNLPAVRLMLDVGFPLNANVGDDGATPLHAAASAGATDVVAFLLERGADVEATDTTWGATPLCWASVGSGFRLGHVPSPDWVGTVRTLIAAGASTEGVWIAGKPPSAEVAAVLHAHGVHGPDGGPDNGADGGPDEDDLP
jgi:ankyrin repeat protein